MHRLSVDRTGSGAIRGLSVITTGEALGHGFEIDETTVEQIADNIEGIPGRWTHGGLFGDGLARHLGRWGEGSIQQFRMCRECGLEVTNEKMLAKAKAIPCYQCGSDTEKAMRAVADFEFSPSAHKIRPDGLDVSAAEYLMSRAEEDPGTFGISVYADFDLEHKEINDKQGKKIGQKSYARLSSNGSRKPLKRADFVADPAANPVGLQDQSMATQCDFDDEESEQMRDEKQLTELAELKAENAKILSDLSSAKVENSQLKTALSAMKEAEDVRKKKAAEEYICSLRNRAVELGQPIPEQDLTKVKTSFDRGDEETARALGEAFLSRAEALSQKVSVNVKTVNLSPASTEEGKELQALILKNRAERLKN